jgi:hypothetical protein
MSLPMKNEKAYLQLTDSGRGLVIAGAKGHAAELAALFTQRGIPCRRETDTGPDEDTLVFGDGADAAALTEILEAYKDAKGS